MNFALRRLVFIFDCLLIFSLCVYRRRLLRGVLSPGCLHRWPPDPSCLRRERQVPDSALPDGHQDAVGSHLRQPFHFLLINLLLPFQNSSFYLSPESREEAQERGDREEIPTFPGLRPRRSIQDWDWGQLTWGHTPHGGRVDTEQNWVSAEKGGRGTLSAAGPDLRERDRESTVMVAIIAVAQGKRV